MRLRRPEPHTLAGAYALDALAGADRARFERHLARCPACAQEQRNLHEATARLAAAVAVDPPAELVERVVAAAGRTRQLSPVTAETRAWLPSRRAGLDRPVPAPRWAWRAAPRRLAPVLTAMFLAAAAGAVAVAVTAEDRLSAAQSSDQAIAKVLTAPDAIMLTARVKAGGTATVVVSRRDRSLVFTTAGLPLLSAGRRYELWLMGPQGDRSAGMLPAPHGGMTSPVTATGLAAGDWVGLTVERAGGSAHPTSKPILMLNLTA
jgi:Anti-sigma-K factor rskA/Putative zinc-finger